MQMTRRTFGLITSAAALPIAKPGEPDVFPYGTHIYREPSLPLEQIREDRRRVLGNRTPWFLFNCTADAVEHELALEGFANVTDLLGEPLSRQRDTVRVRVAPLEIRCLILEP